MRIPEALIYSLTAWLLAMNIVGIAVMGLDKQRARRNRRRIPEARLFAVALLGGSVGCIIGMFAFRHKTRHLKFRLGLPAILLAQGAALLFAADAWNYFL